MSYIYIDESGDLGTKKGSSQYFIISAIKVNDSKKLERVANKIKRKNRKKMKSSNEIKGSLLPDNMKKKLLKKLNTVDYEVYSIILNKQYLYKIGYNHTNNELYDILASKLAKIIPIDSPTFIFVDKSKNKQKEIEMFNLQFIENLNNIKHYPIKIEHADSMHYKGLQIADMISWSTFQNFENNRTEFYNLIENKTEKIVYED